MLGILAGIVIGYFIHLAVHPLDLRLRGALARGVANAWHRHYKPGEDLRHDLEWAWTYCRACEYLGVPTTAR